jgi:hypothetical protein
MNIHKIISLATNEFKQKLTGFCQNQDFSKLSPEIAQNFCEDLKKAMSFAGKVAFTSFIQSYESKKQIIKRGKRVYRYKQDSRKIFLTPFGSITLSRRLFQQDKGGSAFIPLDHKWGIDREFATPEVRESICFACGLMTPEETETLLKKSAMFHPSSTAIKHIVTNTGSFVEEHKEEINGEIRKQETIPEETKAVAISLDGVNVLLNEPGTKKGRKCQRPKICYQNDDKTSFKNAMIGSISFYKTKEDKPHRIESRYVSQMPEANYPTFKHHFENEVIHVLKSLPSKVKKSFIVDGHKSIRGYLKDHPMTKGCAYLIDFYHMTEHLSKASEAIHGKSSEKGKAWYHKWKKRIKEEDVAIEKMYRSMKNYSQIISKTQRNKLQPEITFFRNNKMFMNYAPNVKKGLPIGNGPVEAGCKSIVKARLCRSGMRWSRKGGQNILNFRTYIKSNRWEKFWEQYQILKKAA